MNNKPGRINRIVAILGQRNGASIKELAHELSVSEMTVRRDLELLRSNNIVSLVHGAAIFNSESMTADSQFNYHVAVEKAVNIPEKDRIGKAAAKMVLPGDVIILDIGTTTEMLAKYIPPGYPVTVLCFTMNTLTEIHRRGVECLITGGGYYHADTQLFESVETVQLIRRTRATKLFLSAAGVSRDLGLTCINQYEVSIKQACIESAHQKILLADSSKFDQIRPGYITSLDQMDGVITDSGISMEWRERLERMGIEVKIV